MAKDGFTTASGVSAGVALALALAASALPASAQQTAPDAQAANGNVTSYQPGFFSQFRPNTALDMVTRIPGFSFDGGSGARGFSGTAGNVLIDGDRPPSRSDDLGSVIARIPASAVLRIDLISGGAEGIDMQGRAVVANIIRKPDAGLTGAVNAGWSQGEKSDPSYNAGVQAQLQKNGSALEGALTYNHNANSADNTRQRIDPKGALVLDGFQPFDNENSQIQAKGSWETTLAGGKFRINGVAAHSTSSFSQTETLRIPGGIQTSTSDNTHNNGEIGVRYSHGVGGGMTLDLVGFQSYQEDESPSTFNTPAFTSGGLQTSHGGESIANATLHLAPMGEFTADVGGEAVYNYTESQNARVLNGQVFPLPGDDFDANELRGEAFGTLTWKPSSQLNAELGARYEWSRIEATVNATSSEKTLGYFKPRLNVSWAPWAGHRFNFRTERIVNQLSFGGFASSASFDTQVFGIGNAEIEPDKQWIITARYERQLGGQSNVSLEYNHTQIDDINGRAVVAVPDPATGVITYFEITKNVGVAYRDSITANGSYELDTFGFKGGLVNFGVTFRDSSATDPVTFVGRKLSNDIPFSWNLNVQQTLDNGNFRWAVFLEDDEPAFAYAPRTISKADNHAIFLGANVTWKPIRNWTLGAGVNNIISNDYHSSQLFYDLPRNIGTPLYVELRQSPSQRTWFANLRRNF